MTTKIPHPALLLALLLASSFQLSTLAQSTAFTYQGRLNDGGNPANGQYELRFYLRDALTAGNPVGPTNTLAPVSVSNGLFTVALDFGTVFTGTNYWLEIGVRTNGNAASFGVLAPRQALTPSPYALFANLSGNVVDSTVTAAKIASGQVVKSLNGLRDNLTLAAGTNVTITPSGSMLTIAAAGAGGAGIWSVNGNNAYYAAGNVGIGTSTPNHRLSLIGGPGWTANAWLGSLELANGSAIGWQANPAGQRFGMGHGTGGFSLFRTLSNPGTTGSPALYDFTIDDSGRVGIGTTTPQRSLDINGDLLTRGVESFGAATRQMITLYDSGVNSTFGVGVQSSTYYQRAGAGSGFAWYQGGVHSNNQNDPGAGGATLMTLDSLGDLKVNGSLDYSQLTKLDVADNFAATLRAADFLFGYSGRRGSPGRALVDDTDTLDINFGSDWANTGIWGNKILAHGYLSLEANRTYVHGFDSSGFHWFTYGTDSDLILGLQRHGPNSYDLTVNGTTYTKALTITGGSDVAEPFEMSAGELPKGAVVVIDEENPGRLKLSDTAYDQRVAGIVSGANGVNPGLSLRQEGLVEGGQNVALSGRVYVLADAGCGAIKPGDLLTTATTPGHAMRVTDHAKAQGAVIGKAMSALKEGKGMVLVLVSLQ